MVHPLGGEGQQLGRGEHGQGVGRSGWGEIVERAFLGFILSVVFIVSVVSVVSAVSAVFVVSVSRLLIIFKCDIFFMIRTHCQRCRTYASPETQRTISLHGPWTQITRT